ncbi:tRNA (adenosine(37)-N6)-threonylcarbamoyltransferase complex ATPase subunit type 1 TsaE [Arenibacter certesii]|uniref:tRNA threonylcarbamoyladenosine biosynthesis protein TsaE n=1 Tax=Arenibacter certesii TaxID=228955 RepID=A0A918IPT6_9FLAO|nr:tRNA (adenosine(37)-N6)-threonylcarbamoyltransferase complex ATPase subunit type 1 TsaE [Arenibacter certesii]GGW25765.1 tRNA (adenosine(37)-N6)-threonylcarbamoyltransferase complex ATPase subunit type 1 TsaE [Arenibacter certesii]
MSKKYTQAQITDAAQYILDESQSKTLCFHGDMGAGKTTLIKELVKKLGGGTTSSSPTFGIVNEYHHHQSGDVLGYHFDFYRLENEMEALDLGLEDYLYSNAWIFMEWPEKIPSLIPANTTHIYITILDEKTRSLVIAQDSGQ